MTPDKNHLAELLNRYLQGIATSDETGRLFAWLRENAPESINRLEGIMEKNYAEAFSEPPGLNAADSERMLVNILDSTGKKESAKKTKRLWYRVAAAATVILITAGAILYFLSPVKTPQNIDTVKIKSPVDIKAPRSSHAVITLANGNKVLLDSTGNGQLALQGNIKLVKLAGGQIAYESSSQKAHSESLIYNTLTNPRGSTVIDMILSDGSHVWLNAGSSIKYPVAFVKDKRKVSVSGEVYFEVAPDMDKPFYVTKNNVEVKVLGTRFNVEAYDDEKTMKITLLEGSVKVSTGNDRSSVLKPGQQATIHDSRFTIRNNVDIVRVMAWKNGLFDFNGMTLEEAVPELEHWYDVRVEYKEELPDVLLFGKIDRDLSLADLLDVLRGAGFRFRLEEGRKLVLMK